MRIFYIICLAFATIATAQKFPSLDKSPMDIAAYPSSHRIAEKEFKIIYSRPQLRGRELSKLIPNGKVWRTGANEAPEIVFYKDVIFGGKTVKAGQYNLFAIPNAKEWTIILTTFKNVWGSYSYNKADDVVRIKAPVSKNKENVEAFSVTFEKVSKGVNMYFGWGTTITTVLIK